MNDNSYIELNGAEVHDADSTLAELLSLQLERDSRRYSADITYTGEGTQ